MSRPPCSTLQLDATMKGLPPGMPPMRLAEVGRQGWNVLGEDLPFPVALLKQSALDHNSRWMRRFLDLSGARLCPHGKTTMSPQLFHRQLSDGAWGITLATIQQVRVAREFGIPRILLANQLLARTAIEYVSDELDRDDGFEFYCLVDSLVGVHRLRDALSTRAARRPLNVLVELGVEGKRCGCRGVDAALEVARAASVAEPWLRLCGVEGFEGVITGTTPEERQTRVVAFLSDMVELARRCALESLFAPGTVLLTAGGSCFFDLVTAVLRQVELPRMELLVRSGCYLSHDSAVLQRYYEELLARSDSARGLGEGLRPALEVWAHVLTRPEPTRAILSLGKRDCSFDADLPVPQVHYRSGRDERPVPLPPGHIIVGLHDQHAMLDLPADSPLAVGDLVGCGISHPCTTFDRWQFLPIVDDDYHVIDGIRTFF